MSVDNFKDPNQSGFIVDKSIDMSLLEDDKNANSQNAKPALRPIEEVDENKLGAKQEEERNSLIDSQKSATFPDVPVKL